MRFHPTGHSVTEMQAARRFYQATRQLGAFEGVLAHVVGDYDRASTLTLDLIWALDDIVADASDPGDPARLPGLIARLGRQLTMAVGSLLHDYNLSLLVPVTVMRDLTGHLLVRGDHAMRSAIDELMNRSTLLSEAIGLLLEAQVRNQPSVEAFDLPMLTLVDRGQGVVIVPPGAWDDSIHTIAAAERLAIG